MTREQNSSPSATEAASSAASGWSYHAFLSYSHAADGKLAPALQDALKKFAKPWNRRRALRVFRDGTNLGIHPDLWGEIIKALAVSKYFVLLASPEGAGSKWVGQEIAFWREKRELEKLLIVLTEGELEWRDAEHRLAGNAVHPALADAFSSEPLYLDLRWARTEEDLSLANPAFRESVARLSSELREIPLDELIGEDVRQHKRTKKIVRWTIAGLSFLFLAALVAAGLALDQRAEAVTQQGLAEGNALLAEANAEEARLNAEEAERNAEAEAEQRKIADANAEEARLNAEEAERSAKAEAEQRKIAEEQTRRSVSQLLAVQGQLLVETGDAEEAVTGSLLVLESLRRDASTLQGHLAWASVLDRYPPLMLSSTFSQARVSNAGAALAVSPDADLLAVGQETGGIKVIEIGTARVVFEEPDPAVGFAFHPKTTVLAMAQDSTIRFVNWSTREEFNPIELEEERAQALAFSQDGSALAVGTLASDTGGKLRVFDTSSSRRAFPIAALETPHRRDVMQPAFNPRGRLVMANSWDPGNEENEVRFWDLETRELMGPEFQGDAKALAFSPSGGLAASGGFDDLVKVYSITFPIRSGLPIGVGLLGDYEIGENVWSVAISEDVLVVGNPGPVQLWTLQTGVRRPGLDHHDVHLVSWADEGRLLATANLTEVRLWEAGLGRELSERLREQKAPLEEVARSLEDFRDEVCGRIGRELTKTEWERYLGDEPRTVATCAPSG